MARETSQKTVPKLVELPSSNLCNLHWPCWRSIFILMLNHADVIRDQSDAVTQNAWFRCTLCAAISGEISILIQTGAESWGRFPVPRICRWESSLGRFLVHKIRAELECISSTMRFKLQVLRI